MVMQFLIVTDLFASQLKVKTLVHCTGEEGGRVTIMVTNGNGLAVAVHCGPADGTETDEFLWDSGNGTLPRRMMTHQGLSPSLRVSFSWQNGWICNS